jgi:hypothetical protein
LAKLSYGRLPLQLHNKKGKKEKKKKNPEISSSILFSPKNFSTLGA